MFNYDIEGLLENVECPNCHGVGVKRNVGDTYVCPFCHNEGNIYDEILVNKVCPECGEKEFLELMECYGDYRCSNCGYEGNIKYDIDSESYFWDEALCCYEENEKDEWCDNIS